MMRFDIEAMRALADCDSRSGAPLGHAMREMAGEIERQTADRATLAPYATVGLAALAYYMTGSDMDGETLEDVLIGAGVLNGERVAIADEADVRAAISRAGGA